jgi:cysteine desulfurase/selenocysteine lyase
VDAEQRGGAVSFSIEGAHPHDVSTILDARGVAIRAGHHCAQLLMRALDVPATSRASFYLYNTFDEVDVLVDGIESVRKVFNGGSHRTAV